MHNLDLRITGPGEIVYRPYVLDPENPDGAAELGDNNVDNVEQVVVSETAQAGTFEITVVADGLLARGSQEFALIVSGMTGSAGSAPEVALNQRIQVATDGSGFSTISGEVSDGNGEICELEVEYTTDGSSWYHAEVVDASCAPSPPRQQWEYNASYGIVGIRRYPVQSHLGFTKQREPGRDFKVHTHTGEGLGRLSVERVERKRALRN